MTKQEVLDKMSAGRFRCNVPCVAWAEEWETCEFGYFFIVYFNGRGPGPTICGYQEEIDRDEGYTQKIIYGDIIPISNPFI